MYTALLSFLDAALHPYKLLCLSVSPKPNWYGKAVLALEVISNIAAPAPKHATDDAVYTALFLYSLVYRNPRD